jgi:UDP-N-acetylmuramate dehydrogenase
MAASSRVATSIASPELDVRVASDVTLARYTTFELGGPARALAEVANEDELREALSLRMPTFILGGGSNLVVSDRGYDGLVIKIASRGIEERDGILDVAAGEPWEPFVARAVEAGLAGVECLSGIPGLIGATPIQNVGAYGQEVAQTIVSVRTIDALTGDVRERSNAECGFAYRHSLFKESAQHEIVTRVRFRLTPGGPPSLRYPELEKAMHGLPMTLAAVRDKVIALRRSKSMVLDPDDPNRRSAGSFFMNPIVSSAKSDEVCARALADGVIREPREMPRFPADPGMVKLAAGWLIERSGMKKGTRRGNVGISSNHALQLVHHGGGSADELIALAREIVQTVRARFDVTLRPEPVLLGFDEPLFE